jgi:AcrR family transcriptional regulator
MEADREGISRARRRDARRATQRQRLVEALVEAAASEGFGAVTIADVIARAGVSRPTFYDYFADTEECLRAALAEAQERLLADVQAAVAPAGATEALGGTIARVVEWARGEPAFARVLMGEAMGGGPRALDVRDAGIAEIELLVEGVYERTPRSTSAPDVSPRMAIGGAYRLLARRLRRGEAITRELGGELAAWVNTYQRPLAEHRWRTLLPCPPTHVPLPSPSLLRPTAPGRRRDRSPREDARQLRERILFAAAEIAVQHGYAAANIAEISRRAGLDQRAFHRAFADPQEVITALHELFYQHLMTVSAGAFFSEASWPDRVWDAGLAFAQAAEQDPTLAYVSFVEGPAAGPQAVQRYDDLVSAFTIFLEQGYAQQSTADAPSRAALEGIAWTMHEASYALARTRGERTRVELMPHLAFVVLAPFLGTAAADAFIDRRLGEGDDAAG